MVVLLGIIKRSYLFMAEETELVAKSLIKEYRQTLRSEVIDTVTRIHPPHLRMCL